MLDGSYNLNSCKEYLGGEIQGLFSSRGPYGYIHDKPVDSLDHLDRIRTEQLNYEDAVCWLC